MPCFLDLTLGKDCSHLTVKEQLVFHDRTEDNTDDKTESLYVIIYV